MKLILLDGNEADEGQMMEMQMFCGMASGGQPERGQGAPTLQHPTAHSGLNSPLPK